MHGADDGLWRTLARVYVAIAACGVCIPVLAAVPTLVGFDSFFVTLAFGVVGLGLVAAVTYFVDARLAAAGDSSRQTGDGTRDRVRA